MVRTLGSKGKPKEADTAHFRKSARNVDNQLFNYTTPSAQRRLEEACYRLAKVTPEDAEAIKKVFEDGIRNGRFTGSMYRHIADAALIRPELFWDWAMEVLQQQTSGVY